ncbi:hypothetical protein TELCIR_03417 [Teladorsagia circumcincta]|uniref:Uncharacterized protein n=1 Tax=Teladorsagia circumcincta TaxID=45464 RepID=A0A2G9UWE6_TELCI|nr:hypothetical protein TELCIR_03417 [Teladorsagia circumcincta]
MKIVLTIRNADRDSRGNISQLKIVATSPEKETRCKVYDRASGCGWDATLVKCTDALGLCKGGCRDFAVSASATLHDCRARWAFLVTV